MALGALARVRLAGTPLLLAGLASACVSSLETHPDARAIADRIVVTTRTDSLWTRDTMRLEATLLSADGRTLPARITWLTSAMGKVYVDENGLVTGVDPGSAWIVATVPGKRDSIRIRVLARAAGVNVALPYSSLIHGSATRLPAIVHDSAGKPLAGRPVRWTSRVPGVLTLDSATGDAVATGLGTAWVVARAEGWSDSVRLRVVPRVASVAVMVSDTSDVDSLRLTAVARDAAGNLIEGLPVRFASADPAAATVDSLGRVTWLRLGPAAFTATIDTATGSATTVGTARFAVFEAGVEERACGLTLAGQRFCIEDFTAVANGGPLLVSRDLRRYRALGEVALHHSCDVLRDGRTVCRGFNADAQVGRTTTGKACARPDVTGLPCDTATVPVHAPARIVTGGDHSCVLTASGQAQCWGRTGVIVNSTPMVVTVPTPVFPAGVRLVELTSGWHYSCALDTAGDAWCWGFPYYIYGFFDQTRTAIPPVRMSGDRPYTRITMGLQHICTLDAAGNAFCEGAPVAGVPPFVELNAGDGQTCGATAAGEVWCWPRANMLPPARIADGEPLRGISVGIGMACGIGARGVVCWSPSNSNQPRVLAYSR